MKIVLKWDNNLAFSLDQFKPKGFSFSLDHFKSRGFSTTAVVGNRIESSVTNASVSANAVNDVVDVDMDMDIDIDFDNRLLKDKSLIQKGVIKSGSISKSNKSKKFVLKEGIYFTVHLDTTRSGTNKCVGVTFNFKKGLSELQVVQMVRNLLSDLESVNRKGFITPKDLIFKNIPVLKDLSWYLIDTNPSSKSEYTDLKELGLKEVGLNDVGTSLFKESYKWMCNLIYLNLYKLMIKDLNDKGQALKIESTDIDVLVDYKNLISVLYNKLDPSIRIKLNKPGLGIIQNIYTGFDTEYKYRDKIYNELISAQMAVNTRTYLKIPKPEDFYVCKVDTLSSKLIPTKKVFGFRYDILELCIVECIGEIRSIKDKKYDIIMRVLYKGFKKLCESKPGIFSCYEKDGYLIVSLPRTPIEKSVYLNEDKKGFAFTDLLNTSNDLGDKYLKDDYSKIRHILKNIKKLYDGELEVSSLFPLSEVERDLTVLNTKSDNSDNSTNSSVTNRYSRSKMRSLEININRTKSHYIIAHLTNADLCMLNDFNELKELLDIVNKSFVTLGRPIKYKDSNVYVRDTMLLAPAGKKGLASLGDLLGFKKDELSLEEITSMDKLLINDRERFLSYAIRDAMIPLLYACYMEDQLFNSRSLGIPISLSSLSAAYVKDEWSKEGYPGYQIDPQYLIGDSGATQTPKGLYKTDDVGRKISLFISSYRGGRNESFMYGVDSDKIWYDYDLTSAYTSAMAMLGNPKYSASKDLSTEELNKMDSSELIFNYITMNVKFSFPDNVKYPSIPCYLDENTTIYPLKGKSTITGVEYLLAKEQGCGFESIKDIFMIPFERDEKVDDRPVISHPFRSIIKELQKRRKEYPPKTLGNLMEKEKGNSIYGNVVRGTSNKKKFDIKTGRTMRLEGGVLTNPIIASWTTAFIRSVISECLHNINVLGGTVVSVTTDGFITDLDNLEQKLIRGVNNELLKSYRAIRNLLSNGSAEDALELKTSGKGIISWTTRGQFSLDGKISATTGLQTKGMLKGDLECIFKNTLSGEDRIIEFIQSSLRSAKDIYLHGGHVTKTYSDRIYRMEFDNKRILNLPLDLVENRDFSNVLLDSSPAKDISAVDGLRFLSSFHKVNSYNRMTSGVSKNKYSGNLDLAIRNFVKACIKETPGYNLHHFDNYQSLIDFVRAYNPNYKISKSSISNLKTRKLVMRGVPKNPDTLAFAEYVKLKFPGFNDSEFFES